MPLTFINISSLVRLSIRLVCSSGATIRSDNVNPLSSIRNFSTSLDKNDEPFTPVVLIAMSLPVRFTIVSVDNEADVGMTTP